MLHRRHILVASLLALSGGHANAQGTDRASAFIKSTGEQLIGVINGAGTPAAKRGSLTRILDAAVDVDGIARFCLGRFWRQATPEQQKLYVALFHQVLVTNIATKLGEYQGVKFNVVKTRQQEEDAVVSTTVDRPNNPPTVVDWIIGQPATAPKIIDVVAEGTSLRLTQRSDYAAFLSRNNGSIDALIAAMKQQTAQDG